MGIVRGGLEKTKINSKKPVKYFGTIFYKIFAKYI
jgi:hypothetical protein